MPTTIHVDDTDHWARSVADTFISLAVRPARTPFHGDLDVAALGDGLTVTRVSHSPVTISRTREGVRSEPNDDILILTPRHGSLVVTQGQHRQIVEVGMASVHVAEEPYDLEFATPGDVLVLQAPRSLAPARLLTYAVRTAVVARPRPLVGLFRGFLEEAHDAVDDLSSIEAGTARETVASLMMGVLASGIGETVGMTDEALRMRAQAYIAAHLADPDLRPAQVARRLHVSLRTLHAAFHAGDTSPARLIRETRLRRAHALLHEPRLQPVTVSDIAAMVGLEETTLYRGYRALFGQSPRERTRYDR